MAAGAQGVAKAELLAEPERWLPQAGQELILICQGGKRSLEAALALSALGYPDVASVTGGTPAWRAAGLPLQSPQLEPADLDFHDRYSRHLSLPQVGEAG